MLLDSTSPARCFSISRSISRSRAARVGVAVEPTLPQRVPARRVRRPAPDAPRARAASSASADVRPGDARRRRADAERHERRRAHRAQRQRHRRRPTAPRSAPTHEPARRRRRLERAAPPSSCRAACPRAQLAHQLLERAVPVCVARGRARREHQAQVALRPLAARVEPQRLAKARLARAAACPPRGPGSRGCSTPPSPPDRARTARSYAVARQRLVPGRRRDVALASRSWPSARAPPRSPAAPARAPRRAARARSRAPPARAGRPARPGCAAAPRRAAPPPRRPPRLAQGKTVQIMRMCARRARPRWRARAPRARREIAAAGDDRAPRSPSIPDRSALLARMPADLGERLVGAARARAACAPAGGARRPRPGSCTP